MRKVIEGSDAIAEAAMACNAKVIPVYPITPQTHIVEHIAKKVAEGNFSAEIIYAESEHSAMSAAVGASSVGARTFLATCSQGLALMSEIVYIASGMRLPIVMAIANRALSSPINIWNDHSDTISLRDSSWIQLYCENSQEAYDTIIQAYKIAENEKIKLPAMVCIDGFILSHVFEPVDMDNGLVKKFLPAWKPENKLDVKKPMSFGAIAYPRHYYLFKKQQQKAMENSVAVIKKVNSDFAKLFKRSYGNGLIEEYKAKDAKLVYVAMGSVCSTIREMIDELRAKKIKAGLVKIKSFRPFPYEDLKKILSGKDIAVVDKDYSYGANAALFTEIKSMCLKSNKSKIKSFVMGLGGKDVKKEDLKKIVKMMKNKEEVVWI